jgi:hypothetical protein
VFSHLQYPVFSAQDIQFQQFRKGHASINAEKEECSSGVSQEVEFDYI